MYDIQKIILQIEEAFEKEGLHVFEVTEPKGNDVKHLAVYNKTDAKRLGNIHITNENRWHYDNLNPGVPTVKGWRGNEGDNLDDLCEKALKFFKEL